MLTLVPAAGVAPTPVAAEPVLPAQPNIVLIVTDDQTMDEMSAMPFLQSRPDGNWVEFTDAVISTPLCCPSRATLLTGQYSWNHGVTHNDAGQNLDDTETAATWLDDAGYRTGLVGKYLNTYPFDQAPYIPPGWDDWTAFIGDETGYTNYALNENGTVVNYGAAVEDYSTDVLRDRAVEFLDDASTDPFFLMFTPYGPHAPSTPPERHRNTYATTPVPRSPNVDEADVSDKPAWVQALAPLTAQGETNRESRMRKAYGAVRAVDEAVEALFDTLRANGDLDDTVVIFMTDNGNSFWSHRHAGKQCAYEECINTPLLVRYPGLASRLEPALVSNIDIAPTLADLAGTAPTIPQDGQSLVPLLERTATSWRDDLFFGVTDSGRLPDYWAVRTDELKYIELDTGERELYDLRTDPFELENVADGPAYADERADLASRIDREQTIAIGLSPPTVAADGAATTTATVTVLDAARRPRSGEPVTLSASGDVTISPVVDVGDGTYTAIITASTTPGDEVITATLGPISASTILVETANPGTVLSVTSVDPASRTRGSATAPVSVIGTGFVAGSTVSFGPGVTVRSVVLTSPTLLTVRISVAQRATVGPRNVTVTAPGGGSATCTGCFSVT